MLSKPNVRCSVYKQDGYDVYGAYKYSVVPKETMCNVIKFMENTDRGIVRVDSGATRGNSRELKSETTLLFHPKDAIAQGDKVHILGQILQVHVVHPRFSTNGRHDHDEVRLMIWQSE